MHLPLFVVFGTWSFAPALAPALVIAPILCVFTLLLPLPGCCLYSVVAFTLLFHLPIPPQSISFIQIVCVSE